MSIKSNLIIDQGTDYTTTLEIKDDNGIAVDITGYSANAMIRKTYSSSNAVSFGTTVTGATGKIVLTLSATVSAAMTPGRYVFDVITTDILARKVRIVEGIVTIAPGVTR